MKRLSATLSMLSAILLSHMCHFSTAQAAVSYSGDASGCYIGKENAGALSVTGGSTINTDYSYIGFESGASGTATITDSGSTWGIDGFLSVGNSGSGTLLITNGGHVGYNGACWCTVGCGSGSTGTVTVSGSDSTLGGGSLSVGHSGNGTLLINNSGGVGSRTSYLGYDIGSTGVVTVSDNDSMWNNLSLYVGKSGSGSLSITNSGSVSSGSSAGSHPSYIGHDSDSMGTVTVSGSDSTWTNVNASLTIGNEGNGTLSINNGGSVATDGSGYIGYESGSTGEVTVSGNNSSWTTGQYNELYIGRLGNGTLSITAGSNVSTNTTYVGYGANSNSILNFGTNGGTLTTENLFVSASQLRGTGTINTQGIVSDTNIVLDGNNGSGSLFAINIASQDGGQVTFNLNLSDTVGDLGAGYKGNGSLTVQNGAKVYSETGYIGYLAGSAGTVTVSGSGSSWSGGRYRQLYIGHSGNGTLSISNGGSVGNSISYIGHEAGSTGNVIVSGTDSTWETGAHYIGYSGSGTLSITNGSNVSSANSCLGYLAGSTGEVNVSDSNSIWINDSILIGRAGNATLSVTNGGLVTSRALYGDSGIGNDAGTTGTVTISGSGSSWLCNARYSYFHVGIHGNGIISITDGGNLSSYLSYVGYHSGSTGEVTVSGNDSTWNNHDLRVGYNGHGTLTITNGGMVRVDGILVIDENDDDDSFINMSTGGMLALCGDADDSLEDFFDLISGTDAIQYWDGDSWKALAGAKMGTDYLLTYYSVGDLNGYTVLTVNTVPEPSGFVLLITLLGGALVYARRKL